MKTEQKKPAELLAAIALVAPSLHVEVIWSHDTDPSDIREDCEGFENENPNDWQAWQSEVKVTAISAGQMVSASDYLGGTWEKACDHPAKSNPEISGYFYDMLLTALRKLADKLAATDSALYFQTQAAIELI